MFIGIMTLIGLVLYPFMRKRMLAMSMPVRLAITSCGSVFLVILFAVTTEPNWIWVGMAGLIAFGFYDAIKKRKVN